MRPLNFLEIHEELVQLIKQAETLRRKVSETIGAEYSSQDARQVALDGIQSNVGACGGWICSLIHLKDMSRKTYGAEWEGQYRRALGTGLTIGQAEDLMLDYLRNTLVVKVHFKIENLFSNILRANKDEVRGFSSTAETSSRNPVRVASSMRGFSSIVEAILSIAKFSLDCKEKSILTGFSSLRNSFHSNGIHGNASLCFDEGALKFEFVKGKPVQCASWRHILVLLRANISFLEALLLSEAVANLKAPIEDDYATWASECNS